MQVIEHKISGLAISSIGLGALQFGWWVDEKTSRAILDKYVSENGNFIDTADVYPTNKIGGGVSENIIGRWLRCNGSRDSVVIATKVGGLMGLSSANQGLTYNHIVKAAEASLQRLNTDYIDLYQAHYDDKATSLDETLRAFENLYQRGLIRNVGFSNYSVSRFKCALEINNEICSTPIISLQVLYNLIERHEYGGTLRDSCLEGKISVFPYMPLAKGFLTGKYSKTKSLPLSVRASGIQDRYYNHQNWRILEIVQDIAKKYSMSESQVALSWLLSKPEIAAPVVGISSIAQLDDVLGARRDILSEQDVITLDNANKM